MRSLVIAQNITETALAVIKGGAQRWNRVYFPFFEARIMGIYHQVLPETSDKIAAYFLGKVKMLKYTHLMQKECN